MPRNRLIFLLLQFTNFSCFDANKINFGHKGHHRRCGRRWFNAFGYCKNLPQPMAHGRIKQTGIKKIIVVGRDARISGTMVNNLVLLALYTGFGY